MQRSGVPPDALNGAIKRVLNQPLTDRELIGEKRDERRAAVSSPSKNVSEFDLEKALECSHSFSEGFALKKVMRQWPVGLFKGRVARGNEIFTGGKSAIDLLGISNDRLVLFELKTHLNWKCRCNFRAALLCERHARRYQGRVSI